jgi:hypothetical protein
MTADTLTLFCGAVLSLLFSYVPGLNAWFDALEAIYKRIVMLALLVVVSVLIYVAACLGYASDLGVTASCDRAGAVALLRVLVLAVVANQSVYKISPR